MKSIATLSLILIFATGIGFAGDDSEPPVKKSKTGICHAKGSRFYDQTKNFTPYDSMDACIKSGGRPPKR